MAIAFHQSGNGRDFGLIQAWMDRVAGLPGNQQLCFAERAPLGGGFSGTNFSTRPSDPIPVIYPQQGIGEHYFATLRTPLIAGREFTREEALHRDPVVVLNESAARTFFPGQNALGRALYSSNARALMVVGIAKDARFKALDEAPEPMVFSPCDQGPQVLLVRTSADAGVFAGTVRRLHGASGTGIDLFHVGPLEDVAERSLLTRRHGTYLVGGFGLLGLLIGCAGLYGSLSAQMLRQRRELGIRVALGARRRQIVLLALAQAVGWMWPGALVGLAGSLMAARIIRHQLFGITPLDQVSFLLAMGLMGAATFLACLLPALRAARVDPAETLRSE